MTDKVKREKFLDNEAASQNFWIHGFRKLDKNSDSRIDLKESLHAVDWYDQNGDQRVELWEYMQGINDEHKKGSSAIFSQQYIHQIKQAYGLITPRRIEAPTTLNAILVVPSFLKVGLSKRETLGLLSKISTMNGDDQFRLKTYKAVRVAITGLERAGFNSTEIIPLINKIIDEVDNSNAHYSSQNVNLHGDSTEPYLHFISARIDPEIFSEDYLNSDQVKSSKLTHFPTGPLLKAAKALSKQKLQTHYISSYLIALTDHAKKHLGMAFENFPKALSALLKKNSLAESLDFLARIGKNFGANMGGIYHVLPALLDAELSKEQIFKIIEKIIHKDKEGNFRGLIQKLPHARAALLKLGIRGKKLSSLLDAIGYASDDPASNNYAAIAETVEPFEQLIKQRRISKAHTLFYKIAKMFYEGAAHVYKTIPALLKIMSQKKMLAFLKFMKETTEGSFPNETLTLAISALLKRGFTAPQSVSFLTLIAKSSRAKTKEAYKTLPALLKSGLNQKRILTLLTHVAKMEETYKSNNMKINLLGRTFHLSQALFFSDRNGIDDKKIADSYYKTLVALVNLKMDDKKIIEYLDRIENLFGEMSRHACFAISELIKVGAHPNQIIPLFTSIKNKTKPRPANPELLETDVTKSDVYRASMTRSQALTSMSLSVKILHKVGLNAQQIITVLTHIDLKKLKIVEGSSDLANSAILLKEAGMSPQDIVNVLIQLNKVAVFTSLESLSDTFTSLLLEDVPMNDSLSLLEKFYYVHSSLPEAVSALKKKGLSIPDALSLVSQSTNIFLRAYKYLPWFFNAGLEINQSLDLLQRIRKALNRGVGEEVESALRHFPLAYTVLQKINFPKSLNFLLQVAVMFKQHTRLVYRFIYLTVNAAQRQGLDSKKVVFLLKNTLVFAKTNPKIAFLLMTRMEPRLLIEKFEEFKKGLSFLLKVARGNTDLLVTLVEQTPLDATAITNRKSLGEALAKAINQFYAKEREDTWEVSQTISVLINKLHDQDQRDDLIRKTIASNLDTRAIYYLVSEGGPDLYTSTFLLLYERIKKNPSFLQEIKETDPIGYSISEFILTLVSFRRFWELFRRDPTFFEPQILKLLSVEDEDDLLRNASLLTGVVSKLLTQDKFTDIKNRLQEHLISSYKKAKEDDDRFLQGVYGYLIKTNAEVLTNSKARAIAKKLPQALSPRVPKEWLADGKLKAKLYFYKDESHYLLIKEMYLKLGFVFEKVNSKTYRLKKPVNGVMLEVLVTLEKADPEKDMKDRSLDILGHRGHSFHLRKTFPSCYSNVCRNRKKLLYAGSCGSFRSIPEMMESYGGNYFISDEDTGQGVVNNYILYYLMEAIAKGERDWQKIRDYVSENISLKNRGIIFPMDRSMMIFDFVQRMTQKR